MHAQLRATSSYTGDSGDNWVRNESVKALKSPYNHHHHHHHHIPLRSIRNIGPSLSPGTISFHQSRSRAICFASSLDMRMVLNSQSWVFLHVETRRPLLSLL